MSNLIEVEIENKSYIKLMDLDYSSKGILKLTTLVDNQPGAIIKVFLNKNGNRIPLKEFEAHHISPKVSGLPRFELISLYTDKRLHIELKVDGRKVEETEIKLTHYFRNRYLPLFIVIGVITFLLLILGGKWLITGLFLEAPVTTSSINSSDKITIETTLKPVPIKVKPEPVPIKKTEAAIPLPGSEEGEKPQDVQEVIIIERSLYFNPNNTSIQKSASLILKELARELERHANAVVEISGHCAMSGTEEGREDLSRERAYNTAAYLKQEGWDPETEAVVKWYGGTQPVTSNKDEMYRNRRVEIRIVLPE